MQCEKWSLQQQDPNTTPTNNTNTQTPAANQDKTQDIIYKLILLKKTEVQKKKGKPREEKNDNWNDQKSKHCTFWVHRVVLLRIATWSQEVLRVFKKLGLEQILNNISPCEAVVKYAHCALVYPLFRVRYVNSNEIVRVLHHGIHKLYKGPGYFTAEGLMDHVLPPLPIGNDIHFGPVKLIYVRPGTLKYGVNMNKALPMLLEPGMHYFDDSNIEIYPQEIFLNARDNSLIPVGDGTSFNFIFVKTGSNGVVNSSDGTLRILEAGVHFVESPDTFKTFVSVQQEHIKINDATHKFLTADNIELAIVATLFYKISDVRKVFTQSIRDNSDLTETLLSQAKSMLTTLIRSEHFSNIGKPKMVNDSKESIENTFYDKDSVGTLKVEATAPPAAVQGQNISAGFQSIVKDIEPQFLARMQEYAGQFGFEIQSLRIESVQFGDKGMQEKISSLSLKYAELSAQEATLNIERKVDLAQAEREKQQLMIRAQGEADRKLLTFQNESAILKSKQQLENDLMLNKAKANGSAAVLEAEAESKSKLLKAEAEAEYIRKIGQAEYEVNQRSASLPFANIRIITDAQKAALAGVEKIIYTSDQNLLMKPYMNLMDLDAAPKK